MSSTILFDWREYRRLSLPERCAARQAVNPAEVEEALTGVFAGWGGLTIGKEIWAGALPQAAAAGGFTVRIIPGRPGAEPLLYRFAAEILGRRIAREAVLATVREFYCRLPVFQISAAIPGKALTLLFAEISAGGDCEERIVSSGGRTFHQIGFSVTGALLTLPEHLVRS